ncbi:thymidine phosphorylase, partial [Candidatus Sumerlaeota bacterium]|nr:thymidine phosphorylase [Candidatus Sumerlaeota bacterium]
MRAVDIIQRKRDGLELTQAEIMHMVDGAVSGRVEKCQTAAWLMAIFLRGMTPAETAVLTERMRTSGDVFDLSSIEGVKVDKHSTGGVGDKVSLVLAPLVAAAGVPVPMVSGRGLGHSGGTLDKLEAIPGFDVFRTEREFRAQVAKVGCAIIGQTDNFVPADKLLYSLRDVIACVESIPLITASIMSKKLASGADALVMDVKSGNGAFMKNDDEARALAESLVKTGEAMGKPVRALITDMSQPLGGAVGNALETAEAIRCLQGQGPEDLLEITLLLGSEMLILGGKAGDRAEARQALEGLLSSGRALEKFREMVEFQGGDPRVADDPSIMVSAPSVIAFHADRQGFIAGFDTAEIGRASNILGAGRERSSDTVDHSVGFIVRVQIGDRVETGDTLLEIHHRDGDGSLERCQAILRGAIHL